MQISICSNLESDFIYTIKLNAWILFTKLYHSFYPNFPICYTKLQKSFCSWKTTRKIYQMVLYIFANKKKMKSTTKCRNSIHRTWREREKSFYRENKSKKKTTPSTAMMKNRILFIFVWKSIAFIQTSSIWKVGEWFKNAKWHIFLELRFLYVRDSGFYCFHSNNGYISREHFISGWNFQNYLEQFLHYISMLIMCSVSLFPLPLSLSRAKTLNMLTLLVSLQ